MFSKKEKALLYELIQAKEKFVTSKSLAEKLNCSDRSVRNYIKSIQSVLRFQPVALEAKHGSGYRLVHDKEKDYQTFLLASGLVEPNLEEIGEDKEDRINAILHKLLFEQDNIYLDDLADELYVSRSTLSHDFKSIRQLLVNFDLTIESKANKGIYVLGSERDKRRFILSYFFGGHFRKTIYHYVNQLNLPKDLTLDDLTLIVLEECREARLRLSDFVIQNLVIHIALAIQRLQKGFKMAPIHLEGGEFEKEKQVAKRILNRIEEAVAIVFPLEEIDYIALHLFSKEELSHRSLVNPDSLRIELVQALETLGLDDIYHFSSDHQFMEGVLLHLETLDVRLKNGIHLENPMKANICEQYPDIFYLTQEVLYHLPNFKDKNISDDEIAYVTLHFMASIERRKDENRVQVLVICSTGFGSAQMLRNRLENEFGNRIAIRDVVGYYDITDERLEGIDLILSTIDLSHLIFKVPSVTVSVFLKTHEVEELKKRLESITPRRFPLSSKTHYPLKSQVFLEKYFSKDYFLTTQGISKTELLRTLVERLANDEESDFQNDMLALIKQREEMSSVVFSDTIAVPHPSRALAKHHRVAVAIIKDGVKWDDGHASVQLVFLLSPSLYGNDDLMKITKKIVTLTENKEIQEQLLEVNDFQEFMTIFQTIE
ncbi:BglG family transcription antiterminator [Streptococcus sp. DD12]|uniref:BglG family transcription antiterminator n=1 Tax=Streptococcus sp. DD12 TaxID=1777880 RepID=UPI0007925DB4|nr:BglG family transcription antiterminator [Streptococcus sp. DD12]KXT75715.1 Transcriptional antiterminator of lichenan operon, BglG family [Streptococcus sp. DD12]